MALPRSSGQTWPVVPGRRRERGQAQLGLEFRLVGAVREPLAQQARGLAELPVRSVQTVLPVLGGPLARWALRELRELRVLRGLA